MSTEQKTTPDTTAAATPATNANAPVDEYADAFAEAVAEPAAGTEPKPTAAAPSTPALESDPDAASSESTPAPAAPAPVADASPAAAAPVETPEARIARLEAENAQLRAAPKVPDPSPAARPEPAATPADSGVAPAQPAQPAEPEWYRPTDEETSTIKKFREDWPDIAAAQEVLLKQASFNAVQYVFDQMAKVYNPVIQKFAERADALETALALTEIRGAHSDYDEIHPKVVEWVDTLPAFARAGAKQVMESGTPEEVAELIAEYKRNATPAAGASTSTPAPAATAPVAPAVAPKTELSAAAKKAAGKLSVVGSSRTTPIVGPDPNDFDGAWKEAVAVQG